MLDRPHQEKNKQQAMEASLQTYEAIFNHSRVGLAISAANTETLDLVNPYFAWMHGYTVEDLTGRPFAEILAPEERPQLARLSALLHETGNHSYEAKHLKKDGTVFPVLVNAYMVYGRKNEPLYRIANVVDLTELKKKEQRFQQLYNQANTLVRTALRINADLNFKEVLKTICREVATLLKASCATVRLLEKKTQSLRLFFAHGGKRRRFTPKIPVALFNQYFGGAERVVVLPDLQAINDPAFLNLFQYLDLRTIIAIKLYDEDEFSGVIMLFRYGQVWTVTDEELLLMRGLGAQASLAIRNARLYQELREKQQKLQELHHQVLQAQEAERRRISRELHDEIGQALTALKMKLELMADISCPDCRLRADLEPVIALADETLEKTRYIAYDLRPPGLETVGLTAVLYDYCRTFSQRVGIPVTFDCSAAEPFELSDAAAISLYRILQEALTNVAKHAKASWVIVYLQTDEEFLSMIVQDNGVGLGNSQQTPDTLAGGIGIMGMRERLALIGGKLTVNFSPGEGWRLIAQVPWERLT